MAKKITVTDEMVEAAFDAFLFLHPLPYFDGKDPKVAIRAALEAAVALAGKKPADLSPREELLKVLRPELADGVIEHRQRRRAPLTALAARLLVKKFMMVDDPNAGAEMMIEKGWQGFEPDWYNERKDRGAGGGGFGRGSLAQAAHGLRQEIHDERSVQQSDRYEATRGGYLLDAPRHTGRR